MNNFTQKAKTLKRAAAAVVVSHHKGKSGRSPDGDIAALKDESWEMFDAGRACQTIFLAALRS